MQRADPQEQENLQVYFAEVWLGTGHLLSSSHSAERCRYHRPPTSQRAMERCRAESLPASQDGVEM